MFSLASRVRAERQGFREDNNHRALGPITEPDKDLHCPGLQESWFQGCIPQGGLCIVRAQVLKPTPSTPASPASDLPTEQSSPRPDLLLSDCNQAHGFKVYLARPWEENRPTHGNILTFPPGSYPFSVAPLSSLSLVSTQYFTSSNCFCILATPRVTFPFILQCDTIQQNPLYRGSRATQILE